MVLTSARVNVMAVLAWAEARAAATALKQIRNRRTRGDIGGALIFAHSHAQSIGQVYKQL
jgi:hypothetical protein